MAGRWWPTLRSPLIVTLAIGTVAVLSAAPYLTGWWQDRGLQARGEIVEGVVTTASPRHQITVTFTPPRRSRPTTATLQHWDGAEEPLAAGDTVRLQVDPTDPTHARVAGDHYPIVSLVTIGSLVPVAIPLSLLALRLRHARRAERLAGADVPTYQMLGRLASPRPSRPRGRDLELFPLDDPNGSGPPLAVVPLLELPAAPFPVDPAPPAVVQAKGQVRPYGLIVARAGDETLWPAAPALRATTWVRP